MYIDDANKRQDKLGLIHYQKYLPKLFPLRRKIKKKNLLSQFLIFIEKYH